MGELTPQQFFENKAIKHDRIEFDRDIWPILERLMDEYRAYKYDMLVNNCNHFTNEFLGILTNYRRIIPGWVNRAAWIGSWLHCVVPIRYITVSPEGREEEGLELMRKWATEDADEKVK
jgi:hypothetical protein